MNSKNNKRFSSYAVFFGALVALLISSFVFAVKLSDKVDDSTGINIAAMVAAEQGKNSQDISYRTYNGKQWTKPFFISNNRLNSATPAITVDAEGNIWVMWSEANAKATELRYRIKHKVSNTWGEVKSFETGFGNNALPALITDKKGVLWSFWAAVDGEDDEIFYSRYESGSWHKPLRVAPDNKVPDLEPRVALNKFGEPRVSWNSFDMATYKYRNKVAEWSKDGWEIKGFMIDNPLGKNSLLKLNLPEGQYRTYSLISFIE